MFALSDYPDSVPAMVIGLDRMAYAFYALPSHAPFV